MTGTPSGGSSPSSSQPSSDGKPDDSSSTSPPEPCPASDTRAIIVIRHWPFLLAWGATGVLGFGVGAWVGSFDRPAWVKVTVIALAAVGIGWASVRFRAWLFVREVRRGVRQAIRNARLP